MPKFNAIPDPGGTPENLLTAVRVIKDIVEQLAGLRQGASLGAPMMYMQVTEPRPTTQGTLNRGDLWVKTSGEGAITSAGNLYYWDGLIWRPFASGNA